MKNVFVVEDDSTIREILCEAIRMEGYEVFSASQGSEALRLLELGVRPGLILLDLRMPGMDGTELCSRIKADPKLADIPVVVLSAMDVRRLAPPEADAVIRKPVNLEDLFRVVRQWCGEVEAPSLSP